MYRFIGTLKECERSLGDEILRFVPDQECTVTENCGDNKVKYAVLLPCDGGEGIVFKYEDKVEIVNTSKLAWLPSWKVGDRYTLAIKLADDKCYEIELRNAPLSKYFKLESVIEKA